MPLELQLKRSRYWYGRLEVNGKPRFFPLRVPVEGRPPRSLREEGDPAFERSRAKAQAKLDRIGEQMRERATKEELAQRVLEARTGSRLGSIALKDMAENWVKLRRKRTPAVRYVKECVSKIDSFVKFIGILYPATSEMSLVSKAMARSFMAQEQAKGITGKTYNDVLVLLRSCFHRLKEEAGIAENPFNQIPTMETDTISRIPFNEEELELILEKAAQDKFIYPLIAAAACTAMRLGDCAQLDWKTVDLVNGFINVKTTKTGALVAIPIFAPLAKALEGLTPLKEGFVFPDLARKYSISPDSLTDHVRSIFRDAGIGNPIEGAKSGHRDFQVARAKGKGLRHASVRDIPSFRTTWVTLALNAGVPLELVTKITGHKTVEVVIANYHQPGRNDFRRVLQAKLPRVLTGAGAPSNASNDSLLAMLKKMDDLTWRSIRDELVNEMGRRS